MKLAANRKNLRTHARRLLGNEYTPGRCFSKWERRNFHVVELRDGGETYPVALISSRRVPLYEVAARGNLIAAAPDLLEALRGILDVVNVRIDDPRMKQFDAARAALDKAAGVVEGAK